MITAGEPVQLHEHSAAWAPLAERWMSDLRRALRPLAPRVEHIGSTAVPGMAAKPVVDLQVSVDDVDDEAAYRPALESLGLVLRAREPGHRFFRPPAGQPRAVHVHVCTRGSGWEQDTLTFRDVLRRRPEVAAAYAELKRRLAAEHATDRAAYTDGKTAFVRSVVQGSR